MKSHIFPHLVLQTYIFFCKSNEENSYEHAL